MKYVCLVYFEDKIWDQMSKAENDKLSQESLAYDQELQRSGNFIFAQALQSIHTATTVSVKTGELVTTDGPFAETKEMLGGLIVIEAVDLNEAIRIAAKIPLARWGKIEIRPIYDMQQSQKLKPH